MKADNFICGMPEVFAFVAILVVFFAAMVIHLAFCAWICSLNAEVLQSQSERDDDQDLAEAELAAMSAQNRTIV